MTKTDLLKYIDSLLTQRSDGNIGLLRVRQYVEDNMGDYHTQNLKAYAHDFDCTIEEAEKALRVQPTQKNESNTLEALDCVSRKAAMDAVMNTEPVFDSRSLEPFQKTRDVIDALKELPSVQPERKKGKWKLNKDGNWACPFCEFDPYHDNMKGMNFCPNCGADMRGDEE